MVDGQAPGVRTKPARFTPRLHWELIVCGLAGHEFVGLDAAHLRDADALVARQVANVRWHRCLRCDSWLPLPGLPPRRANTRLSATRSSCRYAGARCATRSSCA